jgi:hypothetical protein
MAPPFLTSAVDGGEQSASCPIHFNSSKKSPLYPLDRRLGGPHSWSVRCEVQKSLYRPGRNGTLGVQTMACGNYSNVVEVPDWNLSLKQTILTGLHTFIWSFQTSVGLTEVTYISPIILSISYYIFLSPFYFILNNQQKTFTYNTFPMNH